MEALPLQTSVPSSHSGKGGGGPQRMSDEEKSRVEVEEKGKGGVVKEAQPPWIKLGLGIGTYSAAPAQNPVSEHGKPASLTPAQSHELQGQALIYKHLEAGLPIPLHLLIPIWKSVASCFGPAIYDLYPSFIGYFSPQGFDYRTMTDPEPGRCRRTDGKKWRCSKNVVPDQKYCERHMHRGRQRSRKPVEAVEISISSDAMPSEKLNDKLGELNANRGNPEAVGLRLMTPSSNHKTSTTIISISNTGRKKNAYCDTITTRTHIPTIAASTTVLPAATAMRITTSPATAPHLTPAATAMRITTTTTPATAPTLTANANKKVDKNTKRKDMSGNKKIDQNTERKDMSGNAVGYHTGMKSSNNRANNISFGISPGLGFSPKSVLQVPGCNNSCFGNRNSIELELGRCRRTDGKKWRCSRDVVPDKKYCMQHMHRGSKRHAAASQTIPLPTASTAASHRASPSLSSSIPKKADHAIPNTDLSISIQASPPLRRNEKSSTSSSSDTTISDTSITANEYG
ncbi:growth-regulating factor 9-like [Corylus avellana]|uniref:growth-regulating factor 9-like n=1 Tax=Corylus avellana TaxID=13451 RepID=UPI00286C00C3|nr:growth-regulating factor 9-like [Corylus avellana]